MRTAIIPEPSARIRAAAESAELIEAEAFAQLVLALDPGLRAELGMQVHRHGRAALLLAARADVATVNRTIGLGFERELDDDTLAAVCERYVAAGVPRWLVDLSPEASPREPGDLFARHGGRSRTPTARMWGSVDGEPRPVAHPELRIAAVEAGSAAAFQAIVAPSLAIPDILAPFAASTIGHERWHHYLVLDGEHAVAGAAMFVSGRGAWLGLAATLPDARGRGAQSLLLARRLHDAAKLGCAWVTAETHPDTPDTPNPSYRNMSRAGMRLLYHKPKYLFGDAKAG